MSVQLVAQEERRKGLTTQEYFEAVNLVPSLPSPWPSHSTNLPCAHGG